MIWTKHHVELALANRANLAGLTLANAELAGAAMPEADFTWINLEGADLSGVDLAWADLTCADLGGANLAGADMSFADLYGANLYGARYNEATKWPDGLDPIAAGAILI